MTEPFPKTTPEKAQESWVKAMPTLKDRITAGVEARKAAEKQQGSGDEK